MKKILSIAVAAMMAACGSNNTGSDSHPATCCESTTPTILGEWDIVNIVLNDSTFARPDETAPGLQQHFTFDTDHSFGITTNCNSIGGTYTLSGDSITFSNMLQTAMACDNMVVEELLSRILPQVATFEHPDDSTLRLNISAEAYIILSRNQTSTAAK